MYKIGGGLDTEEDMHDYVLAVSLLLEKDEKHVFVTVATELACVEMFRFGVQCVYCFFRLLFQCCTCM